jgi:hypothetical protein
MTLNKGGGGPPGAAARAVLGVSQHANGAEVETAYRRLLRYWDPDRNVSDAAIARTREVRKAYRKLTAVPRRRAMRASWRYPRTAARLAAAGAVGALAIYFASLAAGTQVASASRTAGPTRAVSIGEIGFAGAASADVLPLVETEPPAAIDPPVVPVAATLAPAAPAPAAPAPAPAAPAGRAGSLCVTGGAGGPSSIVDVRFGRHAGYDRLVFEFPGAVPAFKVMGGSADDFAADLNGVQLRGSRMLLLTVAATGADGAYWVQPPYPLLRGLRLLRAGSTGQVWGIGTESAGCPNVSVLGGPGRLVIDLRG